MPCALAVAMMLPDLGPPPRGHVLQAQRRARRLDLRDQSLGLLARAALYRFGVPLGRGLRGAVKSMTCELEIELPERRARVFVDGHGDESFLL